MTALKFDTGKIDLTLVPWNYVARREYAVLILPLYTWYRGYITPDDVVNQMREIWIQHGRCLIKDMAGAFNFGAVKYEPWNWEKGISKKRLYAAACRHYLAIESGETTYTETWDGVEYEQNHWWNLAWYAAAIHAAREDE